MTFMTAPRMAIAAALISALPLSGLAFADESMLEDLAGEWTGIGKAQRRADGPLEPIKCKISSTLKAGGLELGQSGRCATTDQTSSISGFIRFDPASGRYTGTWKTTADGKVADLDGSRVGETIVFNAQERGGGASGRIELIAGEGAGYVMRITSQTGGGPVSASEIVFSRR